MRKTKAVESMVFEGYFHVPGNERLVINKEGKIIDLRLLACLIVLDEDVANYSYPVVNVMGQGTLHVHRLLAETFIPVEGDLKTLTVNHIDGNKRNYALSNLEWSTRSDNLLHAYQHGLRKDGQAVYCRNAKTGEVKRYCTMADCARHLNVLPNVIRNYIKAKVPYLFDGIYEIVKEGDNWRDIPLHSVIRVEPSDPSVVCIKDNKYMVFDSAESAGRYLGISEITIWRVIYSNGGESYRGHQFFRRNEVLERLQDEDYVYIPGSFKDTKPSSKRKPIVVKDLINGHVTEWEHMTAFARVVGINRSTLLKAIGKNDGKWSQYQISYKEQSPHSETNE